LQGPQTNCDREGVNRARHLDRIDDEAIAELAAAL
jgi:hypothetical protein